MAYTDSGVMWFVQTQDVRLLFYRTNVGFMRRPASVSTK